MKVAIITANTDIYKGTKANESGEAVKLVAEEAGLEVVFMRALPLDREDVYKRQSCYWYLQSLLF